MTSGEMESRSSRLVIERTPRPRQLRTETCTRYGHQTESMHYFRVAGRLARHTERALLVKIIALVLPLTLETFAVSAALAVGGPSTGWRTRRWLLFAASEAGMPLVGLAIGRPLGAIGKAGDYVAIALLFALAVHMLRETEGEAATGLRLDRGGAAISGVVALTVLTASASLDELAIGFTVGLLRLPVVPVIALIAVQAFAVSWLGMRFGVRVGERIREGAERLSGVALALLATGLLIAAAAG
jgi:manganese efflux pump family protein